MSNRTKNRIVISRCGLSLNSFIFLLTVLISIAFPLNVSWAAPNPPSNLTITAVSSSQIDLSWTDNSNDETGFSIERNTGVSGNEIVDTFEYRMPDGILSEKSLMHMIKGTIQRRRHS